MDLDMFRKAIRSLEGWPNGIGIIGGEPTIHPQFREICYILKDELRVPKPKLGLWTSGGVRYEQHKDLIDQTFRMVALNPHTELQKNVCLHQPLTIASEDVIEDKEYLWALIDDCWAQRAWCPSIAPKGCFFCEVAYALDVLLDGQGGYPIEPNWWRKEPRDFRDQVERYCRYCGMAIPMQRVPLGSGKELISPTLLELFKQHNLRRLGEDDVEVFDRKLTKEEIAKNRANWFPWDYRQDLKPDQPRWRENP